MSMSSPNAWLFASDNSRYSTRARLLFMGLSFAIGILTFLLYLAIWFLCSRRRRRRSRLLRQQGDGGGDQLFGHGGGGGEDHGMSDDAIAALPTFVAGEHDGGEFDCAVCLGQVEGGEKARRLPKCAHAFHADCVDAWLRAHSTCPMCRAAVAVGADAAATATKQTAAAETVIVVVAPVVSSSPATAAAAAEEEEQALPPV